MFDFSISKLVPLLLLVSLVESQTLVAQDTAPDAPQTVDATVDEFKPFNAVAIGAWSGNDDIGIVVGESVFVLNMNDDEALVVDEWGNRLWVPAEAVVAIQNAEPEIDKRLKAAPTSADLLYARSVLAYKKNQYDLALEYSDKLIQHHPRYIHAFISRSQILTAMQRYKDAIVACDKQIANNPDSSTAYVNRGLSYDELGNTEQARKDYQRAIEIDGSLMAKNNLAAILINEEKFVEAIDFLTEVLEEKSSDLLLRTRGKAYEASGDVTNAREDFDEAIELNPGNPENYLRRARFLLRRDTDQAISDFQDALRLSPYGPKIHTDLGAAYAIKQDYESAAKHLARALEAAPQNGLANANMAWVQMELGNPNEALAFANAATKHAPDLLLGHTNRAVILHSLERYEEEIESLSAAIKLAPEDVAKVNSRGIAYLSANQPNKAIDDFKHCVSEDPENSSYCSNLGQAHADAGHANESMRLLGKAIEMNPEDDFAYYRRGVLQRERGKPAGAIDDFQVVVKLDPQYRDAWFQLALAHQDLDQNAEARDAYTKALEIEPNHVGTLINRANTFLALGKNELALQDASQALDLEPLDGNATFNLGLALFRLDRSAEAALQFSILVGAGQASDRVFTYRGDCYRDIGEYEKAISDYTNSIKIDPEFAPLYDSRARCFGRLEQFEKAITDYTKALELDPSFSKSRYQRAHLYRQTGQHAIATTEYERLHKAEPDSLNAMLNLAAMLASANDEASRDPKRALELATKACEATKRGGTLPLAVLAIAEGANGNFAAAKNAGNECLELARKGNQSVPEFLTPAMVQFDQGKPWYFAKESE